MHLIRLSLLPEKPRHQEKESIAGAGKVCTLGRHSIELLSRITDNQEESRGDTVLQKQFHPKPLPTALMTEDRALDESTGIDPNDLGGNLIERRDSDDD